MNMHTKLEFLDKEYSKFDLEEMTGKELVGLHNLIASNLNEPQVRKFKDKTVGAQRVWARLEQYQEWMKDDTPTEPPTAGETKKKAKAAVKAKKADDKLGLKATHKTREDWFEAAVKALDDEFFASNNYKLPEKMRVSCGFAKGGGKAIGQCFHGDAATDGVTHIFICPTQDETARVLDILLHELIHAHLNLTDKNHKHGPAFRKIATEFGLSGKMTATVVEPGSDLDFTLQAIAKKVGRYPHAALVPSSKKKGKAKQVSKWIGFTSTQEKTYKADVNIDRVVEFGRPLDPWGKPMQATKPEVEKQLVEMGA